MTDAVIVSACRTAIGTAFKGTLHDTTAFDLADAVVREALSRIRPRRPATSTTWSSARPCTAAASSRATRRSPPG